MLTFKELKELQEYCDTLSVIDIHDILDQLLCEYKQYKLKRVFESENIRVGFEVSVCNNRGIFIASKDCDCMKYDRWIVNHLPVDDIRELRDGLDELLTEIGE